MLEKTKWWVNDAEADSVSVTDRGLAYGDGLFETMRAVEADIPLLDRHLNRLFESAHRLGLNISKSAVSNSLRKAQDWLAEIESDQAVLKLMITRAGAGAGYLPEAQAGTNIYVRASNLQISGRAARLQVKLCNYMLPASSALAGVKHLSRLDQVMASRELEEGDDEGILSDMEGNLVECISSNIFFVRGDQVITPRMDETGVQGVMRGFLIDTISAMPQLKISETRVRLGEIADAEEIFVSNAVRGVRNIGSIDQIWQSSKTHVGDQLRDRIQTSLGHGFLSF